jgi:hypothetical protein
MRTPNRRLATLAAVALAALVPLPILGAADADYGNPQQTEGTSWAQQAVNDYNPNFFVIGRRR